MPEHDERLPNRVVWTLVAVVGAVVIIGISTGMSSSTYEALRPPIRERAPVEALPARSHAELAVRPWSPGPAAWQKAQAIAAESAPPLEGATVLAAVEERAERRAYDGAPPTIPHPVRASSAGECLACHGEGFQLGNRRAGAIPHAAFASCTQCHVADATFTRLPPSPAAQAANGWQGLASPTGGEIAYGIAPPAVPHSTHLRERCEACHGLDGTAGLRAPHPERASCLQCHPATGGRDGRPSR